MKSYPSIPRKIRYDLPLFVFDKLDGSNVRAEWTPRQGFTRFGSRRRLLEPDHPVLGPAPALIAARYGDALRDALLALGVQKATCFFELRGPNSFAGQHAQEPHEVTLFDVDVARRGLLDAQSFLDAFGHLPTPRLLHRGPIDEDFVESVRSGALEGVSEEGVVCKGAIPAKRPGRPPRPFSFKIKSRHWLERLRVHCGEDEAMYRRLM